jgi:hypothetical protein
VLGGDGRWRRLDDPLVVRMAGALRARYAGDRRPGASTKAKIALLRTAASLHHEEDPEHFEGGCGDVAMAMKDLADAIGMTGVEIVAGTAAGRPGAEPVFHAWLTVDGTRFDPTWETVMGRRGADYKADMAVLGMLCDPDAPDIRRMQVESIHRAMRAAGLDPPPLGPPPVDEE